MKKTMTNVQALNYLKRVRLCKEAVDYINNKESLIHAWNECDNSFWLLSIAFRLGCDDRTLTLAKGHCANTVRHFMKDELVKNAVDTAMYFGSNLVPESEVNLAYRYVFKLFSKQCTTLDINTRSAYFAVGVSLYLNKCENMFPYDFDKENEYKRVQICKDILSPFIHKKVVELREILIKERDKQNTIVVKN